MCFCWFRIEIFKVLRHLENGIYIDISMFIRMSFRLKKVSKSVFTGLSDDKQLTVFGRSIPCFIM